MIIDFPKESHIPGLRNLWQEAFGDTDTFLDHFFHCGYRCRCVLVNDKPVAALYWFDCQWQDKKIAYIYAVATAKSHRRQGLCHTLMEDIRQLLKQQGYAGIALVPAKQSLFAFYEKMGYRCFGGIRQWQCDAISEPVTLTELTAGQYAHLRQRFLPADSVIQDGPLLEFLSTYARFYRGEDFLLCCADDDGKLMAYELLGNTDAAPAILAALGFATGTFRTPGDSPFAMYRSLTDDQAAPQYLAFALD